MEEIYHQHLKWNKEIEVKKQKKLIILSTEKIFHPKVLK